MTRTSFFSVAVSASALLVAMNTHAGPATGPEYDVPVYFDPAGKEPAISPPQFVYDLNSRDGRSLKLGPTTLNESSLSVTYANSSQIEPKFSSQPPFDTVLFFNIPVDLVPEGELIAVTDDGTILWRKSFDHGSITKWKIDLEEHWKQTSHASEPLAKTLFWNSHIGMINPRLEEFGLKPFRFCATTLSEQKTGITVCSPRHRFTTTDGRPDLQRTIEDAKPEVRVAGTEMKRSGIIQGPFVEPLDFFARLANGTTVEFKSRPVDTQFIDAAMTSDDVAEFTGQGTPPFGATVFSHEKRTPWKDRLNWYDTIGDLGPFWKIEISGSQPFLYLPGDNGGFFRLVVLMNRLPIDDDRPRLRRGTLTSTYKSQVELEGVAASGTKVEVSDPSLEKLTQEGNAGKFTWNFAAPRSPGPNRSNLLIKTDEGTYTGYYRLDRRRPFEASARLAGLGLLNDNANFILGEFAVSGWAESLFGSRNPTLSVQRWGASLRYTQSLVAMHVFGSEALEKYDADIKMVNGDIRYRFTPGTWGWTETWGALVAGQRVEFGKSKANMLGAGVFWARSMPRGFDNLFNRVSWLRYPKWVDLDFTLYPTAVGGDTSMGLSWNLNFHGKVMWTDRFFGELGFGAKRIAFDDRAAEESNDLLALHGTAGLGISF